MRVFVSADMEGVSGIATAADVVKGCEEYPPGQELLHGDVNAAVEAGAIDVVVNDAHSTMRNLDRSRLDDRAALIRGSTKPRSMVEGLCRDHDVALFVGYHAMAGTENAVLNHTFLAHELLRLRVDEDEVGELGWNARFAAALGVPVGLVTGDDATCAEASVELGEVETVAVKEGIDRFSARCRPVEECEGEIREAARRAVERAGEFTVRAPDEPTRIEADWSATNHAAHAGGLPGIERVDGRTTAVEAECYPEAFERAIAMCRAGAAGRNEFYG
ncbi:M55 family metallopeptidase [Natronorarus salvus]|uniref:M55 family metallopeptidase n=1 Tax=Natronorarus salvus TaxID=3117733 RepID=UPI002F26C425